MIARLRIRESRGSLFLPWRTLLLAALALAAYGALGPAPDAWVFDRAAIGQGEWWRLITGHWVHSDTGHAFWDIAALVVLGVLFEPLLRARVFAALAAGTMGVDAWLWWSGAAPAYYCGLSGVLNSLLLTGLVALWHERPAPLVLLTGVGFLAKILVEWSVGAPLFTETAWTGVPAAHLAGFLSGLFLVVFWESPGPRHFSRPILLGKSKEILSGGLE